MEEDSHSQLLHLLLSNSPGATQQQDNPEATIMVYHSMAVVDRLRRMEASRMEVPVVAVRDMLILTPVAPTLHGVVALVEGAVHQHQTAMGIQLSIKSTLHKGMAAAAINQVAHIIMYHHQQVSMRMPHHAVAVDGEEHRNRIIVVHRLVVEEEEDEQGVLLDHSVTCMVTPGLLPIQMPVSIKVLGAFQILADMDLGRMESILPFCEMVKEAEMARRK